MWLLNATTEDQRKGIADYFNPAVPVSAISGGGAEVLNGSTVLATESLARNETGGAGNPRPLADDKTAKEKEAAELTRQNKVLEDLQKELLEQIKDDDLKDLAKHIQTRVTPEGLVIELVDQDKSPLFELGSAKSSPTMELLLEVISGTLVMVANQVSIVGHTDGLAYADTLDYTNWDLSTDRANAARRIMVKAGFPGSQVNEVAGKADTEPLVEDRYAPQNRRISITVLRS